MTSGFLLDTQVLIWAVHQSGRLSPKARRILTTEQDLFVSAASLWEIAIKQQLGKLTLEVDLDRHLQEHGFRELAISWAHARQVSMLPLIDRDPFDRILAAQALAEGLTLVTADRDLARYPVRTVF